MSTVSDDSVRVTFFTTRFEAVMPDITYTVPVRVLPGGLSELVNSVLELVPPVPMDFYIDGAILRKTLEQYLRENSNTKSREDVLAIEYAPSLTYAILQRLPHDDWVSSVKTVSFDHGLLLSGCYDSNIRLWHVNETDAECISVGEGHKGPVKEVCLTSVPSASEILSGKKRIVRPTVSNLSCASASKDGSVVSWSYNAENGRFEQTGKVTFHTESVESVDYQHTLGILASGGWDHLIHVWRPEMNEDAETPPRPLILKGHTRSVIRVRFPAALASNNVTLLTTGLDGTLRIWDISGSLTEPIRTLVAGHAAYGLAVRGTTEAATGHTDAKVRLWDSRSPNRASHTFKGHQQWIYSVAYCGEHNIVSSSEDCTVRLWDKRVTNGAMLVMDTQHGDGILDLCPCGVNKIATASKDNTVKITSTS